MDILEDFEGELSEGEIRFRDNLQFELKSEFFIDQTANQNIYRQDFYIFIPASLQINKETYSKDQFYADQTSLIRYKTPSISLQNLIREDNFLSPLIRLEKILEQPGTDPSVILDELQLFGNIFRTALRTEIRGILNQLKENPSSYELEPPIEELCTHIENIKALFLKQKNKLTSHPESLIHHFNHIDEFTSDITDYYLTCTLKIIKDFELKQTALAEKRLIQLISSEQKHRQDNHLMPTTSQEDPNSSEAVLYRRSLLNKFLLEALLLEHKRISLEETHLPLFGTLAAGSAMLIYMTLFAWQSTVFVINSLPFILLAVFFYMLKDRVKEMFKKMYFKQAFKWFPDFSTEIKSRKGRIIGQLNENFIFLKEDQVPAEFLQIRNQQFHDELPDLKRHETVIHYKREVTLLKQSSFKRRRHELTIFFWFNIHQFLQKANNAMQPNLFVENQEVIGKLLPKVYHINVIMKESYLKGEDVLKTEIKKYRIIIDKFGIKRVEQINHKRKTAR